MALTDSAITSIKDMILGGQLRAGERLPPEKALAERLGLSRNSLREAVKSLSVMGVLDVRRGDGTYVTSLEPRLLLEAAGFVAELHDDRSLLEIFEVRRVLEAHSAACAARRATTSVVEGLAAELDSVAEDADVETLVEHDLRFHRAVADAAGNGYLSGLLDTLSPATVRARTWRGLGETGAVARTLAEHRSILEALRRGDPDVARAAMTLHIDGVQTWLAAAAGRTDESSTVSSHPQES
ncbi:FadR/GntR family transcriptional regulator [Klenkia taihuensis]|uniref:Transcriptional regulator, GntR family n=1 Tax=Klenkia taihuensis TaxID=1225127 RepID=A0A1I1U8Z7_9ACTN|nr:FadR/GntR family transcriptional regulator [Klenkia taihuensis]GHE06959.1 GntR family transcriptional regulator [Klenkia taihuensis]SFD65203.1 transcriptional regulator, GntR family [Klenkia taihuensis]